MLLTIKTKNMMKILATLFTTAFFIVASLNLEKSKITATVTNVTSDKGKVSFALYTKDSFMKVPLQAKSSTIINGKSSVIFENIEPGEYAIICFHDKNDNDKMDFQENGMPLEDYGASNNIMSFGPPKYDDAKFTVADEDLSIEIKF